MRYKTLKLCVLCVTTMLHRGILYKVRVVNSTESVDMYSFAMVCAPLIYVDILEVQIIILFFV